MHSAGVNDTLADPREGHMKSVLLFAVLSAASTASFAAESREEAKHRTDEKCYKSRPHMVGGQDPVGAKRLDQLPPAMHILSVLRKEGGCERPVVVRYGIGGGSSQKASTEQHRQSR